MNPLYIAFLLVVAVAVSSTKDGQNAGLRGTYIETSPVAGRTTLVFSGEKLTINKDVNTGDPSSDMFKYGIHNDTISLYPSWSPGEAPAQLYFKQLDEKTLETANLYISIPEDPPITMTFKK